MATFRVGQRVRILWCRGWPEICGKEGVIKQPSVIDLGPDAGRLGWEISVDSWGGTRAPRPGINGGWFFTATDSQIVPIQPERNRVVSWTECLWQPEQIRESA